MIKLYKDISSEIIKILDDNNVDDIKLLNRLKKRQDLIDSLDKEELEQFKKIYNEEEVYKIDKDIKAKLSKEIIAAKKEINDYKVKKIGSSIYANMNKNNLNIFLKKV